MARKRTTPTKAAKIVALRSAGWTLAAIASELSISVSTVQRILKRHPTIRGKLQQELIDQAQQQFADRFTSDAGLHAIFTGFLSDTVAQISLARDKAAEILDSVSADDPQSAALGMRALSAHATAVKAHADTLRQILPKPETLEDLPELIFREMTDADVEIMREEQRKESAALAIEYESNAD